jgi:hypothetical protein
MKFYRFLRVLPLALMLLAQPSRAEQGTIVGPVAGPMTMAAVMAIVNNSLLAIQTCNSGNSAPTNGVGATSTHYQCWVNTTSNPYVYSYYDGASWVAFGSMNITTHMWIPYLNGIAITSGALAFSNLGGSVACPQMPALTGNVTVPAGSCSTSIASAAVSYAMIQNVAASRLWGNPTGSAATGSEVSLGSTLAFSGSAMQTVAGTGDVAWPANSFSTTLATVNSNVGAFGSSTAIPNFTVDGKGRLTAAGTAVVIAPAGTLSGTALASGVTTSSLTTVGTLTGGATGAGFTVNLATSSLTGTVPNANLPVATSSAEGIVQGDGSTLTVTSGTIKCTTATTSQIGCAKPDGTTITASGGVLTAVGAAATSVAQLTTSITGGYPGAMLAETSTNCSGATPCLSQVPPDHTSALGTANVSGSGQNTTGTVAASSAALTLASAIDFLNGQGIRVDHAGAAFTKGAPSALTITPTGTTGSTTRYYSIASVDTAGGIGAAITVVSTTTSNATLTYQNYNALSWTAGSGSPNGYAVYKCTSTTISTCTFMALVPTTTFFDIGYANWVPPAWLPTVAQSSSLADWLVSTVSSGGGTTSVTLAASATTACSGTSCPVYHDDTVALQAGLTGVQASGQPFLFDPGSYYITGTLSCSTARCVIYGASEWGSVVYEMNPTANGISLSNGAVRNRLHDFSVYSGGAGTNTYALGGALIYGAVGTQNDIFERLNVGYGYNGFQLMGAGITLREFVISSCSNVGIYLGNNGDSIISDALDITCNSIPGSTQSQGIFESGDPGGLKIINNKFNAGLLGFQYAINISVQTTDGDILITGNSLEGINALANGVGIQITSSGVVFGNIIVNGNQMTGGGLTYGVLIGNGTAGLQRVVVSNNVINTTYYGVYIGLVNAFSIASNVISGGNTGIYISSATATNCGIGLNTFVSVTTQITDATSACIYAQVTSTKPTYP